MSDGTKPRPAWLDDLGFDVVPVEISEFEKLEGCVTCLSVLCPDNPSSGSGAD